MEVVVASSQDENGQQQEFQYLVSSKGPVIVVTFVGELKSNCLEKLEACQSEVLNHESAKYFLLYMRDVPNITADVNIFFTQFQKNIRSKGHLRLCSVAPVLREKLTKLGIIRNLEVVNNLQIALKEITETLK